MGLRTVMADVALPSAARGAGTFTSGPATSAGFAQDVFFTVHVSAVSGTPTLNVSLEESNDAASWTAVPGSGSAQLTAAGNSVGVGTLTKQYCRITSVVAGGTPNMTYRVVVFAIPE